MQISILFSAHVGVGNDQDFCCGWNFEKAQVVPTESVPRHGVRDQRHLVVRSATPEPRWVLEIRQQESYRRSRQLRGPTPWPGPPCARMRKTGAERPPPSQFFPDCT